MPAISSLISLLCLIILRNFSHAEVLLDPNHGDTALFAASPEVFVLGPTVFPKPTTKILPEGAVPIVEPAFGAHRPDVDAVFAYFEGYTIHYFLRFVQSLRMTGFAGDIVFAIASKPILNEGIWDFLTQQPHIVVYYSDLDCLDPKQMNPAPRRILRGDLDIFQMCCLNHVYGWKSSNGTVTRTAPDPREARVVATLRYEWYWIWVQHYHNNAWIMVIDARDTFFQSNPFAGLPRQLDPQVPRGRLYFFGENSNATRLGKSAKNTNWLKYAYGVHVLDSLRDKPTICSGGTMGEAVAMEQYLRALINEKDETVIKMTGSDQGFHNYLYYSGKLRNVDAISSLTVWDQGRGIINNLGALRKMPLKEWGNYNLTTDIVSNWDGTASPVVHQWDRDADLFRKNEGEKFRKLFKEWRNKISDVQKARTSNNTE